MTEYEVRLKGDVRTTVSAETPEAAAVAAAVGIGMPPRAGRRLAFAQPLDDGPKVMLWLRWIDGAWIAVNAVNEPPRIADIHAPFVRLTGYGRVNRDTAVAVVKAMARAVARGNYGLRLVPCQVVGWRREAMPDVPAELVPWAARVAAAETFYKFDPNDLRMVRDWILSTKERDPRLHAKIPRMSWPAIRVHAERRHARIATAAERTVGKPATPGHVLLRLDGGWTWQMLDTPELLDAEGATMGHCVGGGLYDEDCLIFSLRDGCGVPHVTVEFVVAGGRLNLAQCVGPRNSPAGQENDAAVLRLVRRVGAWGPHCIQ